MENEDGFVVRLSPTDKRQRESIAKQLLTPSANASAGAPNKKVCAKGGRKRREWSVKLAAM